MTDPRYTVQSVARAIELLRLIEVEGSADGLPLATLTRHMSMSKSSVFSTLQTLAAQGFVSVRDDGGAPRYRLGLALMRLGQAAAAQTSVADVCWPELEALSAASGLTSRAAVLDGPWAVAVARIDSPSPVRLDLRLGEKEWPHRSGLGKALMTALPDDEVRALMAKVGMPPSTARTHTTVESYLEDIERSRARGYAMDDEEDAEGIICIAAPVVDATGAPFAAISVTGLKAGPALQDPDRVAELVRAAAARLTTLVSGA